MRFKMIVGGTLLVLLGSSVVWAGNAWVVLSVIIYCGLLALNIWFFLLRPARPWTEKVGVLLQVVGMYTFAFGVLAQTDILTPFETLAEDMTSPDLFSFLAGNMWALGIASGALSVGLEPAKTTLSAIHFLEPFVLIVLSLFSVAYGILHLLVIMPLSYVAYVLVSVPVTAITTSARDITFSVGDATVSIKDLVSSNTVSIKNLMIAFPTMAVTLILRVVDLFRSAPQRARTQRAAPQWLLSHRRLGNSLLLGGQAFIGFFLLGTALIGLTVPVSLSNDWSARPVSIGEVVGVEIVLALFIWALVVLFLKTRRWRKIVVEPD